MRGRRSREGAEVVGRPVQSARPVVRERHAEGGVGGELAGGVLRREPREDDPRQRVRLLLLEQQARPPQRVVGLWAGRVGRDRRQVTLDRVGAVAAVLVDRGQVVRRDARLRGRGVAVEQFLVDGGGVVEAGLAVEVQPRHQRVDGETGGQQAVVDLRGAPVRGVVGEELRPGRVRAGRVALLQAHGAAAVQGEGVVGGPGRDVGEGAVPLVRLRVAAGVLQQQPALQQRALEVEGGRGGVVPDRLVVADCEFRVSQRGPKTRPRQQRLMPRRAAGAEIAVVGGEGRLRRPARSEDVGSDQPALRLGDRCRTGIKRGQRVGGPPGLFEAQQQPDLREVGVASSAGESAVAEASPRASARASAAASQ